MPGRPSHCYRHIARAYTRKSKYKRKAFIKAIPPIAIARFDMGDTKKRFGYSVDLVSKQDIQVKHNSLESARQLIVRRFEIANKPFHLKLRLYPHHALRENKMITGAGADRMQTGMQLAFGRVMSTAAQVKKGQKIFSAYIDQPDLALACNAMKTGVSRLPCRCDIVVTKTAAAEPKKQH